MKLNKDQYKWFMSSLIREHNKGRLDDINTVDEYVDHLKTKEKNYGFNETNAA